MEPSRRSGQRPQNCTEPVGVLHREVRMLRQMLRHVRRLCRVRHGDLQSEPFVHHQPIALPLVVERIHCRIAVSGLQQASERGQLLRHVVGPVILCLRRHAAVAPGDHCKHRV